jgi:hypothetical protein
MIRPGLTNQAIASGADVADIKTKTDTLADGVTQTTGTFSYDETSAAEQTAFTLTIAARAEIGGIWLDMTNVTQDTDIATYHQIDGTNYRQFQENGWLTTDDDGVLINGFTAYRNVRITLQCGGAGGGSVNVPYAVV